MIVGSYPLMSSLSDRNMRLGDVLLPPGINSGACDCVLQGLLTLRRVLKQLSIALSLQFGWGYNLIHARCSG